MMQMRIESCAEAQSNKICVPSYFGGLAEGSILTNLRKQISRPQHFPPYKQRCQRRKSNDQTSQIATCETGPFSRELKMFCEPDMSKAEE